jgi:hypothetical protein
MPHRGSHPSKKSTPKKVTPTSPVGATFAISSTKYLELWVFLDHPRMLHLPAKRHKACSSPLLRNGSPLWYRAVVASTS